MSRLYPVLLVAACLVSGCGSGAAKRATVFSPGEKVTAGQLIYNVIDTSILPHIGSDPATARLPKDRFFVVHLSVSNSSALQLSIPALTLIDDNGNSYAELSDGAGVPGWLGIIRHVEPAQTETGVVIFDAPSKHYRLRLTDETEQDISIDLPLTFVNESTTPGAQLPDALVQPGAPPAVENGK